MLAPEAIITPPYVRAVKEVLGDVRLHDDWDKYLDVTDSGILIFLGLA
jgi:hypothetical protein